MTDAGTRQLEPYDQGYRDGWHDIHVTHRQRRKRGRLRSAEYATGYAHGRIDGAAWPQYREWWPDFAQGSTNHAALRAFSSPGAAQAIGVVSGPIRRPATALREEVA